MPETFALIILSTLVISVALVAWILFAKRKSNLKTVLLSLVGTSVFALSLIILSTGLVTNPFFDLSFVSLLKVAAPPITALLVCALGVAIASYYSRQSSKSRRLARVISFIAGWLLFISMLSLVGLVILKLKTVQENVAQVEEETGNDSPEETPSLLQIAAETLPQGFELHEVLAEGSLDRPIALVAGEDGEIFISTFDGGIYKLAAPPWDPKNVELTPFAPEVPQITGMVYFDGVLYANGSGNLLKLADEDGDGLVDSTEVLIEGLPSRIYDHHSNNGLVLGEDGRFYFGLGGTTDHGPETDPLAGNILVYEPADGSLEVFAYGLRNPYDLTFCPTSGGQLFATDNGPDRLDETLRFVPPDELNLVEEGLHYGYPDFFGFPPPWSDTVAPIALLETAGVPAGIICYEGENFPNEYSQDLFVALAGGSNPATGHKIVRVELTQQDAQPVGVVTDFLTGLGRPVDLIEYQDGSLLILDYDLGQIYQVLYTGE